MSDQQISYTRYLARDSHCEALHPRHCEACPDRVGSPVLPALRELAGEAISYYYAGDCFALAPRKSAAKGPAMTAFCQSWYK